MHSVDGEIHCFAFANTCLRSWHTFVFPVPVVAQWDSGRKTCAGVINIASNVLQKHEYHKLPLCTFCFQSPLRGRVR